MKQKSIASICKPAVTLLAAAAIILLCRKGIIPVHTILLLTMEEGIIRILLRLLPVQATILANLILIGMILSTLKQQMKWKQKNSPRQHRSHPHCGRQRATSDLQREDFPIRSMSPETSDIISSHCLTSRSDRTETKF